MKGSKLVPLLLAIIAVVVVLEEWRLSGLRNQVTGLENDLAEAIAAIPPPPRPVPPGESRAETMRRTKARRVMEEAKVARAGASDNTPASPPATPTEIAIAEPIPVVAEPDPAPAPMNEQLRPTVVSLYGDLIQRFNLGDVEANYFVDLLVTGMADQHQLALDLLDAKTDDQRVAIQHSAETAALELAERIRVFLGNDNDFAAYLEHLQRLDQSQGTAPATLPGG